MQLLDGAAAWAHPRVAYVVCDDARTRTRQGDARGGRQSVPSCVWPLSFGRHTSRLSACRFVNQRPSPRMEHQADFLSYGFLMLLSLRCWSSLDPHILGL